VLLRKNAGNESKKNTVIKTKIMKKILLLKRVEFKCLEEMRDVYIVKYLSCKIRSSLLKNNVRIFLL